jgi:hypothetical protein
MINRADIQKSIAVFIRPDFFRRNFTGDDLAEEAIVVGMMRKRHE